MVGHTIYHPEKGSTLTYIGMIGYTIYHPRKGSTLISDHGRTRLPPCQKGSALTSDHGRTFLPPCQKGSALTSYHGRTRLPPCQNGFALTSPPLGRNLDLENTKILPEVLEFLSSYFYHRITSGLITSKDNL